MIVWKSFIEPTHRATICKNRGFKLYHKGSILSVEPLFSTPLWRKVKKIDKPDTIQSERDLPLLLRKKLARINSKYCED